MRTTGGNMHRRPKDFASGGAAVGFWGHRWAQGGRAGWVRRLGDSMGVLRIFRQNNSFLACKRLFLHNFLRIETAPGEGFAGISARPDRAR
jgi:hypothetical protein